MTDKEKYLRLYKVLMEKALLNGDTRAEADPVIRKYINARRQFDKHRITLK